MAASNSPARTSTDGEDLPESGVGMSHLTVVPANLESVESVEDDDRDD